MAGGKDSTKKFRGEAKLLLQVFRSFENLQEKMFCGILTQGHITQGHISVRL